MTDHVAKVQQHKIDALEGIKSKFRESKDFIFTDFRGLSVQQITTLRGRLREKEAEYRVVKNRYAKMAFRQLELPDVSDFLVGPTALALMKNDASSIAKILFDFAKEAPVAVKGAIVDGLLFSESEMRALSRLPSRSELIAQLMGTMIAPVQNLVYAMNGTIQKLARVLQAVGDKKQQEH